MVHVHLRVGPGGGGGGADVRVAAEQHHRAVLGARVAQHRPEQGRVGGQVDVLVADAGVELERHLAGRGQLGRPPDQERQQHRVVELGRLGGLVEVGERPAAVGLGGLGEQPQPAPVGGDRLERHRAAPRCRADPLLEPAEEPGQRPGRRRALGEQLGGHGLQPDDLVHRPVGGPLQLRRLDDLVAAGPGVDQQRRRAGAGRAAAADSRPGRPLRARRSTATCRSSSSPDRGFGGRPGGHVQQSGQRGQEMAVAEQSARPQ